MAFEQFRADLERAVPRGDGGKGGRPAFDHMLMFRILLLQAMQGLSDERCEYLIKDRLSFMRFLGFGLADAVPDANTIWTYREALKRAGAVQAVFARFDATLKAAGYLAMGGQIVDATIGAAPKQGNTEAEKAALRDGRIPEGWAKKPAKLRQKDRDARWPATHAAAHDGARLEAVLDTDNTASEVWADTALSLGEERGDAGRPRPVLAHPPKMPQGRPMPERTRRANARKSMVRSHVEHVFAHQKGIMGLGVRTIGIARATLKIGMANIVYNLKRLIVLQSGRQATA